MNWRVGVREMGVTGGEGERGTMVVEHLLLSTVRLEGIIEAVRRGGPPDLGFELEVDGSSFGATVGRGLADCGAEQGGNVTATR